jgi:uncharacterized protein with NAD-binding domain and iron-sulfur cluster
MGEAQRSCESKKQLFVSYCHSNQEIVHRVADELTKLNYKIWIDRDLIQGNKLFADIQKGIEISHIVICFISKNYCESENCMNEITLAYTQKKKILPIMLDDYFKQEQKGIKFMISQINSFYAYKQPDTFSPWNNNHFEKLKETIFKLLSEISPISSKNIKNSNVRMCSINSIGKDNNRPAGIKPEHNFSGILNLSVKMALFNLIILKIYQ